MDNSESFDAQSLKGQQEIPRADLLNRTIAKAVDFLIVIALQEIIPTIGFFAGIAYMLIADGLFQGRSPGKRLVGLRVYVSSGTGYAVCGFRESMIRNSPFAAAYLAYAVFSVIPAIGWLLAFLCVVAVVAFEGLVILGSEEGVRMGDELANTRVAEDGEGRINV